VEEEGEGEGRRDAQRPQSPLDPDQQGEAGDQDVDHAEPGDAHRFVGDEHGEGHEAGLLDPLRRPRHRDGPRRQQDQADEDDRDESVLVEGLHRRQPDRRRNANDPGQTRRHEDPLGNHRQRHAEHEERQGSPDPVHHGHLIDGISQQAPGQFIGQQVEPDRGDQRRPRADPLQGGQDPRKGDVAAEQSRDRPARRVPAQAPIDAERLDQRRLRRQLIPGEPLGIARREADGRSDDDQRHQRQHHDQVGRIHPEEALQEEVARRHPAGAHRAAIDPHQHIAAVDQEEVGQQESAALEHRVQRLGQGNRPCRLEMMQDDQRGHDEPQRIQPAAARDGRCLVSGRNRGPGHGKSPF
jgi:hypothetical protein